MGLHQGASTWEASGLDREWTDEGHTSFEAEPLRDLQQSEDWFHTLAEMSPVGIFHADAEGHYLYVNERWCEMAGLAPEEACGQG